MNDRAGRGRSGAARIAAVYLAVAVAWIVLTDLGALRIFFDPIALTSVQLTKGIFFVTASAALLYVLIARQQRRLEETNEELELTLRHASVLHRLLRHNLRNSVDVIRNNVALVREDRCNEEEAFDRIDRQTDALAAIAEKSRHLRDVVIQNDYDRTPVDLVDVVTRRAGVVEAEYPGATVTVEGAAEANALVHPRIGIAIQELLANGIVHADSDAPTVTVRVARDGDDVTVAVMDEGPGLPAMELSAMETTMEDPLEHSRGIGLWLVQFLVAKSEGSLTTDRTDDGCTVVTLTFPAAP